jgi:predicted HicB family RNase H-like nuclease
MVASKAPLIRKALGTELLPISDDGEELKFAWFKMGIPHEELMAYSQFITQLCKTAQEKTRVTVSAPESFENEKFSMRVWLISLDMKGAEFDYARKLMMRNLEGSSASPNADGISKRSRSGERVGKQVLSVRFTPEMLDKIAELAGQSGISRNGLIESVVAEYVQAELPAETDTEDSE